MTQTATATQLHRFRKRGYEHEHFIEAVIEPDAITKSRWMVSYKDGSITGVSIALGVAGGPRHFFDVLTRSGFEATEASLHDIANEYLPIDFSKEIQP